MWKQIKQIYGEVNTNINKLSQLCVYAQACL